MISFVFSVFIGKLCRVLSILTISNSYFFKPNLSKIFPLLCMRSTLFTVNRTLYYQTEHWILCLFYKSIKQHLIEMNFPHFWSYILYLSCELCSPGFPPASLAAIFIPAADFSSFSLPILESSKAHAYS